MRGTRSLLLILWVGLMTLLAQLGPSLADKRVALVVGNSSYKNTPALINPANDASDVAQALAAIGFTVTLKLDASKRQLDQAIEQFSRDSAKADATLFYYAGHGMQYEGHNFVVPVDAELQDEISVRYELTAMDEVKSALERSKGVKIMILDSCRSNPLANKLVRSLSVDTRDIPKVQGYARPEQTRGMIIVYSTQADEVANDGLGRNSPFSSAFLQEIKEPGLEIGTMFRRVGADVYNATNGQQSPELSISLLTEYYLNQGETDQAIWARIRGSADSATIREFLQRYPNSFYAPDASARLDLLDRQARDQAIAAQLEQSKQDAALAEAARLKQGQADRELIASQEQAEQQDLSAKLAAAEAARVKLAAELAQRETAQAEAEARQRAERDKADQERQQREAALRQQVAQMQASQTEKDRLTQEAIEKERANQAVDVQGAADRDRAGKEQADREVKAEVDRVEALKAQIAELEQQAAAAKANAAAKQQTAAETGKDAAETQQKVASAAPQATAPQSPSPPEATLTPQIRGELRRLGCYAGGDADWGGAEMKRGVAKYALYAKLGSPPDAPSSALLEDLKGRRDRLCPADCSAREIDVGGRCIAKTCGHNEMLSRTGLCIPRPIAPHETAAAAPPHPSASPGKGHCFVFNGNQYCE